MQQAQSRSVLKDNLDFSRRNVLKFLLVGGAAFALGKFAAPIISFFTGEKVIQEAVFGNFRVTETNRSLTFTDKSGDEIFIIEKDAF